MLEQRIAGNEELNDNKRFINTRDNNVYNENASYVEQINNFINLLYFIIDRLFLDNFVTLKFAKN